MAVNLFDADTVPCQCFC